jgi:hypothetical protein
MTSSRKPEDNADGEPLGSFAPVIAVGATALAMAFAAAIALQPSQGYRSDQLDALAQPIFAAMNAIGVQRIECEKYGTIELTVRDVRTEFLTEDRLLCPITDRLTVEAGERAQIRPSHSYRALSDVEAELQSESLLVRKDQFSHIATSILKNKENIFKQVSIAEMLDQEREAKAAQTAASWRSEK